MLAEGLDRVGEVVVAEVAMTLHLHTAINLHASQARDLHTHHGAVMAVVQVKVGDLASGPARWVVLLLVMLLETGDKLGRKGKDCSVAVAIVEAMERAAPGHRLVLATPPAGTRVRDLVLPAEDKW